MSRPSHTNSEENREISNYDKEIDSFFGKLNSLSDHMAEKTKRLVAPTKDVADLGRTSWSDMNLIEKEVDSFFNKPYQTMTGTAFRSFDYSQIFNPFSFMDVFAGGGAETPYGLYSYTSPTTREYNTCLKKDGLSLWDSEGTWRCLFPNSAIPLNFLEYKNSHLVNQILTKDDFERSSSQVVVGEDGAIDLGQKGIFFKQFEDLMKWKNAAYESQKRSREQMRERYRASLSNSSWDTKKSSDKSDNEPVSWSSERTSRTDPKTNQVILTESETEFFRDGSSVTNTATKKKAIGADIWETVEEKSHRNEDRKGWFWN